MRLYSSLGFVVVAALSFAACSKSETDPATFCPALMANAQMVAGTLANEEIKGHDQATVEKLADSTDKLAGTSPSALRSSVRIEAAAYHKWAQTGDMHAVSQNGDFAAAAYKVKAWARKHCE